MTISTQTMGVITMAMVGVTGLAVANSIVEQRSVGDRMLFYEAEEITMDLEIMEDWGQGSTVEKNLNTAMSSISIEGSNPEKLVVVQDNVRKESPIYPINSLDVDVDGGEIKDVGFICIRKTGGSSILIEKGDC